MLEEICDKIGYKNKDISYYEGDFYKAVDGKYIIVDEREIIFTEDFFDKLDDKIHDICLGDYIKANAKINNTLFNLDNPTFYLYNTLGLGKQ